MSVVALHWATFHNCRVDETGQRVGDVSALCGDNTATSFVFRPEQITCAPCIGHRARLLDENAAEPMPFRREYFCEHRLDSSREPLK